MPEESLFAIIVHLLEGVAIELHPWLCPGQFLRDQSSSHLVSNTRCVQFVAERRGAVGLCVLGSRVLLCQRSLLILRSPTEDQQREGGQDQAQKDDHAHRDPDYSTG